MDDTIVSHTDLPLAQLKFLYASGDASVEEQIKTKIFEKNMAPLYEDFCKEFDWKVDGQKLTAMKEANEAELKRLGEVVDDAIENLGESEIRDAMLARADYYCSIGDKENCIKYFSETFEKTVALGHRLDIIFSLIRLGLFYMDHELITKNIEKATQLIDEGGDWDRRNRLKVYEGLYKMSIRDFSAAAKLFLDTVSTFSSLEIMTYETFVFYTALCCILTFDRVDLGKKVIKAPEMIQVSVKKPIVKKFLDSFYTCQYAQFFLDLEEIEKEIKFDRYLNPHFKYYVREMRIAAYNQLLESYSSVTISSMANSFGVSEDFVDRELSRFISADRLACKIDKVDGIVSTNHSDFNTFQYRQVIKHGDLLLNRVQKLSRVIDM